MHCEVRGLHCGRMAPLILLFHIGDVVCIEVTMDKSYVSSILTDILCHKRSLRGNMKAAALRFTQTFFDTCVFILILRRTLSEIRNRNREEYSIGTILLQQGIIYYT